MGLVAGAAVFKTIKATPFVRLKAGALFKKTLHKRVYKAFAVFTEGVFYFSSMKLGNQKEKSTFVKSRVENQIIRKIRIT